MPAEVVSFRAGDRLRAEIDARGTRATVASRDLQRYYLLLAEGRARVRTRRADIAQMVEAVRGGHDVLTLRETGPDWARGLPLSELIALVDAAERWPTRGTREARLRTVGLA